MDTRPSLGNFFFHFHTVLNNRLAPSSLALASPFGEFEISHWTRLFDAHIYPPPPPNRIDTQRNSPDKNGIKFCRRKTELHLANKRQLYEKSCGENVSDNGNVQQ